MFIFKRNLHYHCSLFKLFTFYEFRGLNKNLILADKVRERIMRLISKAYSSLNLPAMAIMTGMPLADARQAAIDRGWDVQDNLDATIVLPWKKLEELEYSQTDKICLTEEQLQKLTQFVSFLEN